MAPLLLHIRTLPHVLRQCQSRLVCPYLAWLIHRAPSTVNRFFLALLTFLFPHRLVHVRGRPSLEFTLFYV